MRLLKSIFNNGCALLFIFSSTIYADQFRPAGEFICPKLDMEENKYLPELKTTLVKSENFLRVEGIMSSPEETKTEITSITLDDVNNAIFGHRYGTDPCWSLTFECNDGTLCINVDGKRTNRSFIVLSPISSDKLDNEMSKVFGKKTWSKWIKAFHSKHG
jgi:hypothetical protein